MSFGDTQPSNRHRWTVEKLSMLAVAIDAAATAGEPCSMFPDNDDTIIDTLTVEYSGTPPAAAKVTVIASTQEFSDENTGMNRLPRDQACYLPGRMSALRRRLNNCPKSNDPKSLIPTRRDGAVFKTETTPTQSWSHSRGESRWI